MPKHRGLESCAQMYDIPKPFSGLEIVGKEIQVVNRFKNLQQNMPRMRSKALYRVSRYRVQTIGNPNNRLLQHICASLAPTAYLKNKSPLQRLLNWIPTGCFWNRNRLHFDRSTPNSPLQVTTPV